MTLFPYVQERFLRDRQRELQERAHTGATSGTHPQRRLLGHDDPLYSSSARMVSWAPPPETRPRAAYRLAAEGVACWESCSLAHP